MAIKAAVFGVTGYTGQTLIRILLSHPHFELAALYSIQHRGPFHHLVPDFIHANCPAVELFDVDACGDIDVIFLAVPHTKAMGIAAALLTRYSKIKVIDLSADFRLKESAVYESIYGITHTSGDWLKQAIYGLPEKYTKEIESARLCANPGCYATAMILGLLPLRDVVMTHAPIVIDAKSGVSGAGKHLKEASLFCEVHDHLSAYATGKHRHMAELVQETGFENAMFSPHLVPMNRGIESAIYIHQPGLSKTLKDVYRDFYSNHPFIRVCDSNTPVSTRLVAGTNYCVLIIKPMGDWVVVFSLIDNLLKGASGQAIQNANIMFGLDQRCGLDFK